MQPATEPVTVLEYSDGASHALHPSTPLVHRCIRTALVSSAAFCAATGAWAEVNWPHTSNWGYEKLRCFAFVQNASGVALATFVVGVIWLMTCRWYRRSVIVNVALWSCPVMFLYFGGGRN